MISIGIHSGSSAIAIGPTMDGIPDFEIGMHDDELAKVAAELKAMHQRAKEAFLRKDAGAYMDIFAPSLKYGQADGKVIGRDKLAAQVRHQLRTVSSVENSYVCEKLEMEGERAIEILEQTASAEIVHLGFIRRRISLHRRGRYSWERIGGEWKIVEVEVLEEKMMPASIRFGLR